MSDASEKVLGIKHLPIFPLSIVLMPSELLPLHIFEEKYRQMVKDVELNKNLFGLNYFNPEEIFAEKPEPGTIGCVAEINESQTLPDGRSNILTIGIIRYRIVEYINTDEPYLIAGVEFFEDFEEDEQILKTLSDEVFILFKRVAQAAHKISGQRGTFPDIPQAEPEQLSFLITSAFNLENDLKYKMLETRSTVERLENMKKILDKAVKQIEDSAEIHKISQTNGHSKKKIKL
ncbi:MAG: LON peptidase substrate-binding domain-containing protein [Pyrinomonadaceae bacterium]